MISEISSVQQQLQQQKQRNMRKVVQRKNFVRDSGPNLAVQGTPNCAPTIERTSCS